MAAKGVVAAANHSHDALLVAMEGATLTGNCRKDAPVGEERKGSLATAKNIGVAAHGTISREQEGSPAARTAVATVPGKMSCATDLAVTATATKEGSAAVNAGSHEGGGCPRPLGTAKVKRQPMREQKFLLGLLPT